MSGSGCAKYTATVLKALHREASAAAELAKAITAAASTSTASSLDPASGVVTAVVLGVTGDTVHADWALAVGAPCSVQVCPSLDAVVLRINTPLPSVTRAIIHQAEVFVARAPYTLTTGDLELVCAVPGQHHVSMDSLTAALGVTQLSTVVESARVFRFACPIDRAGELMDAGAVLVGEVMVPVFNTASYLMLWSSAALADVRTDPILARLTRHPSLQHIDLSCVVPLATTHCPPHARRVLVGSKSVHASLLSAGRVMVGSGAVQFVPVDTDVREPLRVPVSKPPSSSDLLPRTGVEVNMEGAAVHG